MRKVTRALVGAIVASLVAAAVSVYAETPTKADFAACNTDAQAAMKAGTATPTTKDYVLVGQPGRAASRRGPRGSGRSAWRPRIPSLWDGDRWDDGRRVSGDVSHVHAMAWILRRLGRKRKAGLQPQRDTEDRTGIGGNGRRGATRRRWSLDGTVGVA